MSTPAQQTPGTFTPQKMRDAYQQIARLKALGLKNTEIASQMNVSPQMVGYVVKSPMVQEQINRLHNEMDTGLVDIQAEIAKATPAALATALDLMLNATKEETRLKAAESILDRNPVASKHTTKTIQDARMTQNELDEIKKQAVERARASGILSISEAKIIEEPEE